MQLRLQELNRDLHIMKLFSVLALYRSRGRGNLFLSHECLLPLTSNGGIVGLPTVETAEEEEEEKEKDSNT